MFKELTIGLPVHCQDGPAGRLELVIADPDSHEPAYLVVTQGRVTKRRLVVPAGIVAGITAAGVLLNITREALHSYPDYEVVEKRYQPPAERQHWPYPPPFRRPFYDRQFVTVRHRSVPENTVAVRRGLTVYDRAGEKIGTVEGLVAQPLKRQPKHLIVRRSRRPRAERRLVPVDLVDFVIRDDVYLRVKAEDAGRLQVYVPEGAQAGASNDEA